MSIFNKERLVLVQSCTNKVVWHKNCIAFSLLASFGRQLGALKQKEEKSHALPHLNSQISSTFRTINNILFWEKSSWHGHEGLYGQVSHPRTQREWPCPSALAHRPKCLAESLAFPLLFPPWTANPEYASLCR